MTKLTARQRFAAKTKRDELTGCLIWTGAVSSRGYGVVNDPGRRGVRKAHRLALDWKLGYRLPSEVFACHTCDTPLCVAPEHLFPGSNKDNHADSVFKGRHAWGERNGNRKLTEDAVRAIRGDHAAGVSGLALARQFGVGPSAIYKIIHRTAWKLVE